MPLAVWWKFIAILRSLASHHLPGELHRVCWCWSLGMNVVQGLIRIVEPELKHDGSWWNLGNGNMEKQVVTTGGRQHGSKSAVLFEGLETSTSILRSPGQVWYLLCCKSFPCHRGGLGSLVRCLDIYCRWRDAHTERCCHERDSGSFPHSCIWGAFMGEDKRSGLRGWNGVRRCK